MYPHLQWPIYSAWTWSTPVIPNLYWNTYSMEQRFKNLCLNQGKMTAYLDEVAENTNEWAEEITNTFDTEYNNFTTEINDKIDDFEEEINIKVEEIESLVTDSRKYIGIIGDSWSAYSSTDNKWTVDFAEMTGYTLINKAVNGTGFTCGYSARKKFYEQMQELIEDSHYDMIDYIIVYGGINDWNHGPNWDGTSATPTEMTTGFLNLINVYKNKTTSSGKKPKLIFVFGNVGLQRKSRYIGYEEWYYTCLQMIRGENATNGLNACIVDYVPWWLTMLPSPENYFNSDEIHPTELGYKIVTEFMLQIVNGVYTGVHRTYEFDESFFLTQYITLNTSGASSGFVYSFDNGILTLTADIHGSMTFPANTAFRSIAQIPNNISPMLTPYNHSGGNQVSWIWSSVESQSFRKIENDHLFMYNYMFNPNNGVLYLHSLDHAAPSNEITNVPDCICIGKITNG